MALISKLELRKDNFGSLNMKNCVIRHLISELKQTEFHRNILLICLQMNTESSINLKNLGNFKLIRTCFLFSTAYLTN